MSEGGTVNMPEAVDMAEQKSTISMCKDFVPGASNKQQIKHCSHILCKGSGIEITLEFHFRLHNIYEEI